MSEDIYNNITGKVRRGIMRKGIKKAILSVTLLLSFVPRSEATVIHSVNNAVDFQVALDVAESNADGDVILLARGTYVGNFSYVSTSGYDLAILGGFSTDWTRPLIDPSNTVLDGDGSGTVLNISDTKGGSVFIEGVTIQNGYSGGLGWGLKIWITSPTAPGDVTLQSCIIKDNECGGVQVVTATASGTAGDIVLKKNVIKDNDSNGDGGGVFAFTEAMGSGSTGEIVLINNIIVRNSCSEDGGGVAAAIQAYSGEAHGYLILTNNTITENIASVKGGGVSILCPKCSVFNNIIWWNIAPSGGDIWLASYTGSSQYGSYNNYSDMSGSWNYSGSNIDQYPFFMGYDDFHLQRISPCIDKGYHLALELPSKDFDGDARQIDGNLDGNASVDIGADEFVYMTYVFDGHDFNGLGNSEIAVFRPSNGRWYIRDVGSVSWGASGDVPVNGDYDGDNVTEIAVWRPSNGRWYVYGMSNQQWGTKGDIPVPGDYNGDGTTDLAVWRPSNGRWYLYGIGGVSWGQLGDIPVPGDYNGDGRTDLAVWRPSNARWYIKDIGSFQFGIYTDIPVPGDYDGDGDTDIAVWRPSNGRWYIRNIAKHSFGCYGDFPVPGDYKGDGTTDIAVWRPSTGRWYIKDQKVHTYGMAGDIPVVR
jgi:hypothetical protein